MPSAFLPKRGVIRIYGEDRLVFLQGLVTQDMRRASSDQMLYSCLLTPQGKYLADFFVTQADDAILLDIDRSLLTDVIKRLSMFKLRSRVVIEDVSEHYHVSAVWQTDKPLGQFVYVDPRATDIGWRVLGKVDGQDDYMLWQMQNGLPDVADFVRERTSMLEANMDLLNALSWEKGCYMGQELTARTHYRGLIKKRLLPIRFTQDVSIEPDTAVEKSGKIIGHTRSQHKNQALVQLQLEALQPGDAVTVAGQNATVIFPHWFIQL